MIRAGSFITALSVAILAAAIGAQEGPKDGAAPPKKVPIDLIKEVPDTDPKDKGKEPDPAAKGESPKEIIERLHKNMELANVQLKDKNDPTAPTRKIQTDIIDDLDKLIKQQKDNESNCKCEGGAGGASSGAAGGSSSGKASAKGGSKGGSKKDSSAKGGGKDKKDDLAKGGKDKEGKDKDGKGKEDMAKGGDKDGKDKGGKDKKDDLAKGGKDKDGKDKDGKDGKGKEEMAKGDKDGKGAGGGGKSEVGKPAIAAEAREVWGHLPLEKRMEMDALPNERALPRYEKLIGRFYRNASEKK